MSAHLRQAWRKLAVSLRPLDQLIQTQSLAETLDGRTYYERAALRVDIRANGIREPILLYSKGEPLIQDGHQRYLIAKALGLEMVPVTYVVDSWDDIDNIFDEPGPAQGWNGGYIR